MFIYRHEREFPEPTRLPQKGDVYIVRHSFGTYGHESYDIGDRLEIQGRTLDAPYGFVASTGNLMVKGKGGKITAWSSIEAMLHDGWIELEEPAFT